MTPGLPPSRPHFGGSPLALTPGRPGSLYEGVEGSERVGASRGHAELGSPTPGAQAMAKAKGRVLGWAWASGCRWEEWGRTEKGLAGQGPRSGAESPMQAAGLPGGPGA